MKTFASIDAYIKSFPAAIQRELKAIRKTIRAAAPKATEKIAWGMPTYHQHKNLVFFAAFKKHISFFPTAAGVAAFKKELARFDYDKGTIRFPLGSRIPHALIGKIVRFRVKQAGKPAKKKIKN